MTRQDSLPIAAADKPRDIAVTGWAGITVRVAWTLLTMGVKVKPAVLRDARDHVLYHLDPHTPLGHAEDRAGTLTKDFVSRARRGIEPDPWPTDGAMLLSPRWRRALETSLSPLTERVFRQHFADGRSLAFLVRSLQVDEIALEGARGGLREVLRRVAVSDGIPLDKWPSDRIDRLLSRLAAFSPGVCPPLHEVIAGTDLEHTRNCARCDRTQRLINAGLVQYEDLLPPPLETRPDHTVSVLALHFHPDGKTHRAHLAAEIDAPAFPVGDDTLLVDFHNPQPVTEVLELAAEVACPHRDLVRGAVLHGPGRWSRHGLLGPLATEAGAVVRSRAWSIVDTIGELPEALPEPPSAGRWWIGTAALAAAAIFSVFAILGSTPHDTSHPADVVFTSARGGVWTAFDVPDGALVTLIREYDGELGVVLASEQPADKVAYAVGDGSYRLHTMGPGVLLVSSSAPVRELHRMVDAANRADAPLEDLAKRISVSALEADLHWMRQ